MQVAEQIEFAPKAAELQWWAVAKVAAVAGIPPHKLNRGRFDTASGELLAASAPVAIATPRTGVSAPGSTARRRRSITSG